MSGHEALIQHLADACGPDADVGELVREQVRTMPIREIRRLATEMLSLHVRVELRIRTLKAERAASSNGRRRVTASSDVDEATRSDNMARFGVGVVLHGSVNKKNGGVTLGCECAKCSLVRAEELRHAQSFQERIGGLLDNYRASLRIEWTEELRRSTFVLRDGRRVEWGAASLSDHQERSDMFMANVVGNLEGAARHEQAIADLSATGAGCLDDLVAAKAVAA